eukprot:Selendium_serpulae@DN5965_c6_g2_i2.p2
MVGRIAQPTQASHASQFDADRALALAMQANEETLAADRVRAEASQALQAAETLQPLQAAETLQPLQANEMVGRIAQPTQASHASQFDAD